MGSGSDADELRLPTRTTTVLGLAAFVASGCASLIYEVVWLQQLGLTVGASSVSLAILLTSFMGGMCLGSLIFARLVPPRWHPLTVYAFLELAIGGCGLAIHWLLPAVGRLYWSLGALGSTDLVARSVVALLVLLPPTALMGATLPALSRLFDATPAGLARLGRLCAANTLGAVIGCLAAGLYLLRVHDTAVATGVAAGLNLLVAGSAAWLRPRYPWVAPVVADPVDPLAAARPAFIPVLVIALSGMTALGSEVVYTRLLALIFGPTVYTFSIILAVFLFGLSLGNALAAWLLRRTASPARLLAVTQILLALAIPAAAFLVVRVLPEWWGGYNSTDSLWWKSGRDLIRALAVLLPATCLWGASFPLAVAAAGGLDGDRARRVGTLYSANTLGAILGALGVSLIVIPAAGSRAALQLLTALAGVAGALMMIESIWRRRGVGDRRALWIGGGLVGLLAGSGLLATSLVPVIPDGLLAWGRQAQYWPLHEYVFVAEGLDSAIAVSNDFAGVVAFHVAGKVEASNTPSDMRTQRFLGHLPALAHGSPKRVLVICCGSGTTVGAILRHPSVEQLTLCEIEAQVITASRKHFSVQNEGALEDPRVKIVIDDGRHFLATTREKFDIISTDPIHPWVRGAAALYTREFYELCREHLNPGGIVTQWIPLYESSEQAVKCELATLLSVFPNAALWSGQGRSVGYDIVALATMEETLLQPGRVLVDLYRNPEVCISMASVGYTDEEVLINSFAGYGAELRTWLANAEVNRDANLRLQYLAGLIQAPDSAQTILDALRSARSADSSSGSLRREPLDSTGPQK